MLSFPFPFPFFLPLDCSINDPKHRENLGIIVQYKVKVKLCLGPLGGDVVAELPFTLMHPKPEPDMNSLAAVQEQPPILLITVGSEPTAGCSNNSIQQHQEQQQQKQQQTNGKANGNADTKLDSEKSDSKEKAEPIDHNLIQLE